MSDSSMLKNIVEAITGLDVLIKKHLKTLHIMQAERQQKRQKKENLKVPNPHLKIYQNTPLPPNMIVASVSYRNLHKLDVKKEKVMVQIKVNFMKIGVIDTIHDRYSAEIMVQTKWREPKFDEYMSSLENVNLSGCWNPQVSISNGIDELVYQTTIFAHLDSNQKAWICERKKTNGQFFEFMELHKFPFDSQDLTVTVISERADTELNFVQDDHDPSSVNSGAFSAAQEWKLHEDVGTWTKITVKQKAKHPCFCVAANVSRRPQFFMYNVVIIMFSICSLSFATFSVKLEQPEFRLPLSFLLLLTTVTFKFVVNKSLPRISYLTYLDKYILGSMVILCFINIWHSVSGSIINTWTQTDYTITYFNSSSITTSNYVCPTVSKPKSTYLGRVVDWLALGIFAAVYVAFHLGFLVLIIFNTKNGEAKSNISCISRKPRTVKPGPVHE